MPSRGKVTVFFGTKRVSVASRGKVTVFFGTKRVSVASSGKGAVFERFWLCGQLRSAGASTLCILPLWATVYEHVVSVVRTRETRVPPPGLNPGTSRIAQWVKRRTEKPAQCCGGFESPVQQAIFLPESTLSADSVPVLLRLPCTTTCINICAHVQNRRH